MSRLSVLPLLVLTGCGSGVSGSCVGPMITVNPTSGAPGDELTVEADNLWDACYDVDGARPAPPRRDIDIVLTPEAGHAREITLATVDADDAGRVNVTVTIPADVPAGTALVHVDVDWWTTIQITDAG